MSILEHFSLIVCFKANKSGVVGVWHEVMSLHKKIDRELNISHRDEKDEDCDKEADESEWVTSRLLGLLMDCMLLRSASDIVGPLRRAKFSIVRHWILK